ncbi:MAG TPA: 3'-5' exonuclease, partial [Chromatiaceae bacterium]|nr:3'-5' exonuclease [Chromatiaceae bacterium]
DPKQAIYGFRGGDIFAYGEAKADLAPGAHYSLGTNWRSTPEAITAINALFGRRGADAFVLSNAVPFAPVTPAQRPHQYLQRDGKPQTALTLWTLPDETDAKGKPKSISKEKARDLTRAALAQEVAALVADGRAGRARLAAAPPHRDDRNLEPRDIAVLVRSRFEGAEVRKTLADWGVRAVSVERTPVFATDEARALRPLLAAVLEPGDRALAREALASPLLALGYGRIEALTQGEAAWAQWLDGLLALRETWQRRGFMAMFQALLRHIGTLSGIAPASRTCPPSLEAKADPGTLTERRLTNLLHLGELLQQASKAQAGMDALLAWYRARCAEADAQIEGEREYQVRLESDADLVQIVTIHSAKGLEYPVVFLPDLWGCKPRDATGLVAFHEGLQPCLDAGSDDLDAHLRLAERERLAEDLRLVYVALTRARSALYLAWGRVGSKDGHAGQTALGWLLHPHQDLAGLIEQCPDAFANLRDLQPDLDALARAACGTLRVLPIPLPEAVVPIPAAVPG